MAGKAGDMNAIQHSQVWRRVAAKLTEEGQRAGTVAGKDFLVLALLAIILADAYKEVSP
jgi:hypothetical protein